MKVAQKKKEMEELMLGDSMDATEGKEVCHWLWSMGTESTLPGLQPQRKLATAVCDEKGVVGWEPSSAPCILYISATGGSFSPFLVAHPTEGPH